MELLRHQIRTKLTGFAPKGNSPAAVCIFMAGSRAAEICEWAKSAGQIQDRARRGAFPSLGDHVCPALAPWPSGSVIRRNTPSRSR